MKLRQRARFFAFLGPSTSSFTPFNSQFHAFKFPDYLARFPIARHHRATLNVPAPLYLRRIEARVAVALTDTPVVLIAGPRQAGKTTLVRQMADPGPLGERLWAAPISSLWGQ